MFGGLGIKMQRLAEVALTPSSPVSLSPWCVIPTETETETDLTSWASRNATDPPKSNRDPPPPPDDLLINGILLLLLMMS